jgi:hypothetical protein
VIASAGPKHARAHCCFRRSQYQPGRRGGWILDSGCKAEGSYLTFSLSLRYAKEDRPAGGLLRQEAVDALLRRAEIVELLELC